MILGVLVAMGLIMVALPCYKFVMSDKKTQSEKSQEKLDARAAALRANLKKRKSREKILKSDAQDHKA